MNERVIGGIDVSALNVPPEKHEHETALYFAKRGWDVVFMKPSSIKKQHSPDFIMNNKIWEIKSPIVFSKSSFEDNLRRAVKQSENIIYDLRRLRRNDEMKYINNLIKRSNSQKIRTLIVIPRDGKMLTIKGVFDSI